MKKLSFLFCLLAFAFGLTWSCSETKTPANTITEQVAAEKENDTAQCSPTIKDPNNPKPMALMMRTMVENAQKMREKILAGESLDSTSFPFIRFYLAEPTDPSVREPQFFENARLFQVAYKELFRHPKEQKKYYNLMIQGCVNCHESYCSGPLRRIKKLPI